MLFVPAKILTYLNISLKFFDDAMRDTTSSNTDAIAAKHDKKYDRCPKRKGNAAENDDA